MVPDLILAIGPHALLSLVGIVLIIAGVWYVDRTWDEKGAKAYAREKEKSDSVTIPEADLDDAFPFPAVFLIGWLIFAISYLFPTNGGTELDLRPINFAAVFFSLMLGVIASVPMGDAVRNRKAKKKKMLSMGFVLSWIGLTVTSGLSVENGVLPFVFCAFGMVFIVASMKVLWKHRKMGDTWEQEGRPNPNPVVYNPGGPLFVFGWFLFWVGMGSTSAADLDGLTMYFNARTAIAFIAGCGMVPIVMFLDYAHDEGSEFVGFGTEGKFFGRFLESPIPFVLFWALFVGSSLLTSDNSLSTPDLRHIILVATGITQGIVAGVLIQTALYKGNLKRKQKLSVVFVLLFICLAVNIGWDGGLALYLAIPGAMLVIAGQKTVFADRKRGDYWMEHNEVNPNPIVYSVGEPLFMTGWILLSLAISQPIL